MVVQMSFVQMGTDGTLKTILQKPPGKFAADFVYLIGCCLAGLKTLNNMVAHIAAVQRLAPTPLCCLHKIIGVLRVAVKAGNIELVLGFIAVLRVVHQPLHICGVQILRLLRIGGIIQAAFQLPAHRQNLCDCHYCFSRTSCQMRCIIRFASASWAFSILPVLLANRVSWFKLFPIAATCDAKAL